MITVPITRVTLIPHMGEAVFAITYVPVIIVFICMAFYEMYEYDQLDGLVRLIKREHTERGAVAKSILEILILLAIAAGAIGVAANSGILNFPQYEKSIYSVTDDQCEKFTDQVLRQRKLTVVSDESCDVSTMTEGKPDTWYTTIDRRVNVTRKEDSNTVSRIRVRIKVPNSPSGRSTVSVVKDTSTPEDTSMVKDFGEVWGTIFIMMIIIAAAWLFSAFIFR